MCIRDRRCLVRRSWRNDQRGSCFDPEGDRDEIGTGWRPSYGGPRRNTVLIEFDDGVDRRSPGDDTSQFFCESLLFYRSIAAGPAGASRGCRHSRSSRVMGNDHESHLRDDDDQKKHDRRCSERFDDHRPAFYEKNPVICAATLAHTSAAVLRTWGSSIAMTSTAIVARPNHSTVAAPRCSFHMFTSFLTDPPPDFGDRRGLDRSG